MIEWGVSELLGIEENPIATPGRAYYVIADAYWQAAKRTTSYGVRWHAYRAVTAEIHSLNLDDAHRWSPPHLRKIEEAIRAAQAVESELAL